MIASIYKIVTDSEGESKVTFNIPSSELINVVKLNALLRQRLILDVKVEDDAGYNTIGEGQA